MSPTSWCITRLLSIIIGLSLVIVTLSGCASQSSVPTPVGQQPSSTWEQTPTSTSLPNRQLDNGTFLQGGVGEGEGELTIKNGRDRDAVAILVSAPDSPRLSVYIRANDSFTIEGIADGTYYLYFTLGEDWDSAAALFTRSRQLSRFVDTLEFVTSSTEYTTFEVTLYKVSGGNAAIKSVDYQDFPSVE